MLLFTVWDMHKKNSTFKPGTLSQYSSKEPKHSKQANILALRYGHAFTSLKHLREEQQDRGRKIFD